MKATINEEGFIVVTAENSLERFALTCWMERMDAPFGEQRAGWKIDLNDKPPEPTIPQPSQERQK